ncbi:MAG: hypothetical protein ORN51_09755, partial [Akkermansiaceae bacterium]|nr:hypothetical protein [Akkermansiaceae bacterium]
VQDATAQAQKRMAIIGSVIFSLLTLGAISTAVVMWVMPRLNANAKVASAGRRVQVKAKAASRFPTPTREEAIDLVKSALANRDVDKLQSFFRMGTSSPAEVIEFLEMLGQSKAVPKFTWRSSIGGSFLQLEGVSVSYSVDLNSTNYIAYLTPDGSGKWKIDFDALANVARPSWKDLIDQKVERAVVRVYGTLDNYFNGPFGDDQWLSYSIAVPNTEDVYYGYVMKESEVANAMRKISGQKRQSFQATIEISRVKDALPRQFQITKVVSPTWVMEGP